ncbi:hypothetical protein JOQ06_014120 [Pogonophryne albipinna]|uniref:Uncharacterized protein n=1 Tax=Pogonophryne albipinna TaxID=1090488 RepID=A0AAD6F6W5_9TELE|nr:hypothetical protein JOQ06_014120 [Pogonophryne albipinna]
MEAVLLALLPCCTASCLRISPSLSPPPLVLQLDSGSTTETLFRFKLTADQLGISTVRVHTTARGRDVLRRYQQLLFTSLYTFDYQVHDVTCSTDHAHKRSPGGKEVEEEVSGFLQQLPAQRGGVQVLKSPLIPECFGHGFSTRAGGVSSIASLSSLNLFSSSRRRDSVSVVQENRRRLALKAGFNPRDLQLVKVDHGSAVWVVGGAEPERYDAMVTDQRGRVLAAPGADCMPLLFAERGSRSSEPHTLLFPSLVTKSSRGGTQPNAASVSPNKTTMSASRPPLTPHRGSISVFALRRLQEHRKRTDNRITPANGVMSCGET